MSAANGYTVDAPYAPPVYDAKRPSDSPRYGATAQDPLLPEQDADASWAEEGGHPDDYKTTVAQSSAEIRHAFVRKVFSTLFVQILASVAIGAGLRNDAARGWVLQNTWSLWTSMILSFVALFGCFWKRHSHPLNLGLLGTFTVFEAYSVGAAISFYRQDIVLQALLITTFLFLGLTLFTFQSKYDFSGLGPWLFSALLVFLGVSLVSLFFPFSRITDAVFAGVGVLLFSGYILYDTHMILNRLSPDEFILASISLYLDALNLFLMILRLLNDIQRD